MQPPCSGWQQPYQVWRRWRARSRSADSNRPDRPQARGYLRAASVRTSAHRIAFAATPDRRVAAQGTTPANGDARRRRPVCLAWALVQFLGDGRKRRLRVRRWDAPVWIPLAILIGALASAEERSLGTLHWQTLQPYAASKQWTIKTATALSLTVLLVVALPALLRIIGADAVEGFAMGLNVAIRFVWSMRIEQAWFFAAALLTLTTIGLFTSSFNRSSLHALLAAGLLGVLCAFAVRTAFTSGRRAVWTALDLNAFYKSVLQRGGDLTWVFDDFALADRITLAVIVVATVGFLLMLVTMGLKNHRSAETPRALVARQVVTLLAYGVVAGLVAGGGQSFVRYFLATH